MSILHGFRFEPRTARSPARRSYEVPAGIAFLILHGLAVAQGGANAKIGSYLFLVAAPLWAAVACIGRARRDRDGEGWIALALAVSLWAAGMAANLAVDLLLEAPGAVPGISMLLYVLFGVPLIFAVASPADEKWYIRAVDGCVALALGALFWLHTFSFAAVDRTNEAGFLAIRWLFDMENVFIAVFALARWRASSEPKPRSFFFALASFAAVYAVVAAYINHLAYDVDFGAVHDLLIPLPFLWLVWAARHAASEPPARAIPHNFLLAVRAGSPLMLPATLLVVACTLIQRTPQLAAAGFVVATLGYGLRSILVQMRGISERERLDQLSHHDALTGLPNRRLFDTTLQREWARACRLHATFAVLIIDIDHFKQLNDRYGHPVGDERLRAVAQTLTSCLTRRDDFVARYGGEEFATILTATTEGGAFELAEEMRMAVASMAPPAAAPAAAVTVSIGLAWLSRASVDLSADLVLSRADTALYSAKERGRNRVECSRQQQERPRRQSA